MDRLVKLNIKELNIIFKRDQKCSASFTISNLMHTMPVALSLSLSSTSSSFTLHPSPSLSLLPPLSTSSFTLHLTHPSPTPPLSSPPESLTVRSAMLPTGKASQEDLRRLFSKPGSHIFRDANIPISLSGPHVVESLFCPSTKTLEIDFLLSKALSGCHVSELHSLLRSASKSGYSHFVRALIDSGADPNCRDSDSNEPSILSLAIRSGVSESVRALIEANCSIESSDLLLHDAVAIDRVDLLEMICVSFEDIHLDSTDELGRTALHIAAIRGNSEAARFLVTMGCDPEVQDSLGWTPLHYASSGGDFKVVKYLVDASVYAKNSVNKDGDTAFTLAVEKGHSRLYDMLHLGDELHRAARTGDVSEVNRCLAEGAKVNSRDQNGWTPLHRAAFKGKIECVKALLNNGAKVDIVEDGGRTAIQLATEAGHLQVVVCLTGYGANKSSGKIVKSLGRVNFRFDRFKDHLSLVTTPLCQDKQMA